MLPSVSQHDSIRIRDLAIDCVVGVYPSERDSPQPLRLDVDLCLDTEPSACSEKLSETVDYAFLSNQLRFILQTSRFRLLETAAHVLSRYLLARPALGERRAAIESVDLTLTKPLAFDAGAPSVRVRRDAAWATFATEHKDFGVVDVIAETRDVGLYRLNIAPKQSIPLHVHKTMEESEMVLSKGLLCQRAPVAPGTVFCWPKATPHVYENPTDRYQTVLCVDRPPFLPLDEIPVSEGDSSASISATESTVDRTRS